MRVRDWLSELRDLCSRAAARPPMGATRRRLRRGGAGRRATAAQVQSLEPRALLAAQPVGLEFRANTHTTGGQLAPSVAMDADGDYVAVWTSAGQDGDGYGVYGQRYNAAGISLGSEFRVNGTTTGQQMQPRVAMDADGDFVVVWTASSQDGDVGAVYARRFNESGVAQGTEFRVNTWTTGNQDSPSVAIDTDGDFVVVWESIGQDGHGDGIYAQRFDAAGVAQGSEFRVNSTTASSQANPSVAMDADGDFVVVWQSYGQDGDGYGVYGQRFSAAGLALGAEFRVNTYTTNEQSSPKVAMDADGDFVVVWESYGQDGDAFGVYGRLYDAEGVVQGADFQINVWTTGVQGNPTVAMDADGDLVVAWETYGQDGSAYGIFARRYDAAGVARGDEFLVNSATTGVQRIPSVSMDADGGFLVAWEDVGFDGDGFGVFARRYDAAGAAQASQFQVNMTSFRDQSAPSVSMEADGDFLVAWTSLGQDGNGHGVFARRYGALPALASFGPSVSYTENAAKPTILSTTVTATNPNASEWKGGAIIARVTASNEPGDRLSVVHDSFAKDKVGVVDLGGGVKEIRYGNVRLGTATGGDGANPLVVAFDSFAATAAAVQAVLRRIGYATVSDAPSTTPRQVSLAVRDRFNGQSQAVVKQVAVAAVNDAPVLGGFGAAVNYARGLIATAISAGATVTDDDSADFFGGKLTLQLTNGKPGDVLSINSQGTGAGEISVLNNFVYFEGVFLGTFVGGSGSTPLVVTLNTLATPAATQALLRNILFSSTLSAPVGPRTVKATLTDGDGGSSAAVTKSINVT